RLDAASKRRDHAESRDHDASHLPLLDRRLSLYVPDAAGCQGQGLRLAIVRRRWFLALGVLLEEFHRIADGEDGLRGIVGNFTAELFLEGHDQFDRIEAVGTEVVDKARRFRYLFGFHAQVLHYDFFYPLANVAHRCTLVSLELGSIGQRPRAT